ncbi:MAG: hypothetical protein GY750_03070 [Lentisphaerae bacterium]|nr:hypothetical protein [Lentisphaerota bacterium]MCP4100399.1 hypothetical protein [Lentisphaerota bacterium]
MKFSAADAVLKCPYCGSENEIPQSDSFEVKENDFMAILETLEQTSEQESIDVYSCDACGAEVEL